MKNKENIKRNMNNETNQSSVHKMSDERLNEVVKILEDVKEELKDVFKGGINFVNPERYDEAMKRYFDHINRE